MLALHGVAQVSIPMTRMPGANPKVNRVLQDVHFVYFSSQLFL